LASQIADSDLEEKQLETFQNRSDVINADRCGPSFNVCCYASAEFSAAPSFYSIIIVERPSNRSTVQQNGHDTAGTIVSMFGEVP